MDIVSLLHSIKTLKALVRVPEDISEMNCSYASTAVSGQLNYKTRIFRLIVVGRKKEVTPRQVWTVSRRIQIFHNFPLQKLSCWVGNMWPGIPTYNWALYQNIYRTASEQLRSIDRASLQLQILRRSCFSYRSCRCYVIQLL